MSRYRVWPCSPGRLDDHVAAANHPLEDCLAEGDGIDHLVRDLLAVLGHEALPMDHPLVGDDMLGGQPVDQSRQRHRQPDHCDRQWSPLSDRAVGEGSKKNHGDQRGESENEGDEDRRPMGTELGDDRLSGTQEFFGV